jgi:hypothetical protein
MTTLRHLFVAFILLASLLAPVAFAAPVPVPGDLPVPVDRLRLGNPAVLAMTGTWRFKLEQGVSPAVEGRLPADAAMPGFAAPAASDADWKTIPVPANWEIEGFSMLTYQERPARKASPWQNPFPSPPRSPFSPPLPSVLPPTACGDA